VAASIAKDVKSERSRNPELSVVGKSSVCDEMAPIAMKRVRNMKTTQPQQLAQGRCTTQPTTGGDFVASSSAKQAAPGAHDIALAGQPLFSAPISSTPRTPPAVPPHLTAVPRNDRVAFCPRRKIKHKP
jgi:hypothetical protein